MGADKGVLITDDALDGSDSLATAKALAAAIKDMEYDLIFTGQRGVDDDMGVVGAAIAEILDIPSVSLVVKLEVAEDGGGGFCVRAERRGNSWPAASMTPSGRRTATAQRLGARIMTPSMTAWPPTVAPGDLLT